MNIQDFANLATVAGNTAVVIAVLFAVRQLRISTTQVKEGRAANRFQLWVSVQTQAIEFYKFISAAENVEIYLKGRENPHSLNSLEASRFFYFCVAWFTLQENIFEASQTGYLPAEYFTGWMQAFDEDLKDAGFLWFWTKEGHLFDKIFQERVNRILSLYANPPQVP
jgi:hypothetical protein